VCVLCVCGVCVLCVCVCVVCVCVCVCVWCVWQRAEKVSALSNKILGLYCIFSKVIHLHLTCQGKEAIFFFTAAHLMLKYVW